MTFNKTIALLFAVCMLQFAAAQTMDSTYAEKLGFPKGAKVLILHVDDAGMSYDSNEGAANSITKGAANSVSVMMPCPWVPGFVHYMKAHPGMDAGLHLTLTSEWGDYRWGPLAGKANVPGLVDTEGAMWSNVEDVVKHASADEVDKEIRAQLERARTMGFEPTHLDSHMGTLFASPEFLKRYIGLGIEKHIPVMFPGGADVLIGQDLKNPAQILQLQALGKMVWAGGLPVLDDLHNVSYDWKIPEAISTNDKKIQAFKTAKFIEALKSLQPGVTMMIMHSTATTDVFPFISGSGPVRRGDMLAMMDPLFKKALKDEGIVLTTWRELQERRDKVK